MKQKNLLAIGVITAALSLYASANAQMTGAGVSITNKASASYLDSLGQPKGTDSNEVVTIVQQVYGISLTPNTTSATGLFGPLDPTNVTGTPSVQNDKDATPNSSVRFDYVLVNNGNGPDTITLASVQAGFTDNFNLTGVTFYFDAALTSPVPSNQVTLTAGQQINIYVKNQVPGITVPGNTALMDVTAAGLGGATDIDNNNVARVTVVADAILAPTKTGAIQNCGPDLCILYTITGSNTGTQAANAVTLTNPANAANTLGVLISDAIPVGTVFDTGFTPTTTGGTAQQVIYSATVLPTDPITGATWTLAAGTVVRVGALLKNNATGAAGAVIAPSGNFSLSFRVRILSTTLPGTDITNTVQATYNNNASPTPVRQDVFASTTNSNPTNRDVAIGPVGVPFLDPTVGATTPPSFTDPITARTWSFTQGGIGKTTYGVLPPVLAATPALDFTEVATAPTGTTISYVLTLQNRGNDQDQFVLSFVTPNGATGDINESFLPAGSTVDFFDVSGNTSLSGNTTTNVAANGSLNVVVKIFVPAATASNGVADVVRARIKVASVADSAKTDFTVVRIGDLVPGQAVDLRNELNGSAGPDPLGDTPTGTTVSKSVTPNPSSPVTVNYPITVTNNGSSSDSFNLTTSSLPPGVTGVQFFLDVTGDGIPDSATPLVGGNTGILPAGATGNYVAVLTVAANAAPVPQDLNAGATNDDGLTATDDDFTITTTSASNPAISDSIVDSLVISPLNTLILTPSRNGDVTSPGSIVYPHTLTNDGSSLLTTATFALSGLPLPPLSTLGFSYTIYRDTNNNGVIDGGDVQVYSYDGTTNAVTSINILPGAGLATGFSLPYLVQVNTSAGIPEGTVDTRTLTVTGTFGANGTGTSSVIDTTRIVKGELRLRKFATPCDTTSEGGVCPSIAPDPVTSIGTVLPRSRPGAPAPAGDTASQITYTIIGENIGSAAIGGAAPGAVITDPIPANSDFVFGSANTAIAACVAAPGNTCAIEYSVDNGALWSITAPTDTNANGISDLADATRVTNIRVVVTATTVGLLTNPILNGSKITLSFKVSVR
jgi:trimeric autotransporter adhesin